MTVLCIFRRLQADRRKSADGNQIKKSEVVSNQEQALAVDLRLSNTNKFLEIHLIDNLLKYTLNHSMREIDSKKLTESFKTLRTELS